MHNVSPQVFFPVITHKHLPRNPRPGLPASKRVSSRECCSEFFHDWRRNHTEKIHHFSPVRRRTLTLSGGTRNTLNFITHAREVPVLRTRRDTLLRKCTAKTFSTSSNLLWVRVFFCYYSYFALLTLSVCSRLARSLSLFYS